MTTVSRNAYVARLLGEWDSTLVIFETFFYKSTVLFSLFLRVPQTIYSSSCPFPTKRCQFVAGFSLPISMSILTPPACRSIYLFPIKAASSYVLDTKRTKENGKKQAARLKTKKERELTRFKIPRIQEPRHERISIFVVILYLNKAYTRNVVLPKMVALE